MPRAATRRAEETCCARTERVGSGFVLLSSLAAYEGRRRGGGNVPVPTAPKRVVAHPEHGLNGRIDRHLDPGTKFLLGRLAVQVDEVAGEDGFEALLIAVARAVDFAWFGEDARGEEGR